MRFLSRPRDEKNNPISAQDVFDTCVAMVRDITLRSELEGISNAIEKAAKRYDTRATAKALYLTPHTAKVQTVKGDELVRIYTLRMVPKKAKGRPIYNLILSAPVNGRCPFCGIGTVNTLDHFLPKTHFPVFSVTPNNLVPACEWCQGEKMEYFPTTAGEQLLHPYYDDFDQDIWLEAKVVAGSPAAFRYSTAPPKNWSKEDKSRVAVHLKKLNLTTLFSSNAGSRLTEIRGRLVRLYDAGGIEPVRAHLYEELASIEEDQKNSWVAAMYRAAIDSDWFCNGGFR
jgi:5-methylcytosine-specific restriction endonuclease McrA